MFCLFLRAAWPNSRAAHRTPNAEIPPLLSTTGQHFFYHVCLPSDNVQQTWRTSITHNKRMQKKKLKAWKPNKAKTGVAYKLLYIVIGQTLTYSACCPCPNLLLLHTPNCHWCHPSLYSTYISTATQYNFSLKIEHYRYKTSNWAKI